MMSTKPAIHLLSAVSTVRSHTAGHTVYPVRDEPHPHRKVINRPRRAGSPVASSPIRCTFHRYTVLWPAVIAPLYCCWRVVEQILPLNGWFCFEVAALYWFHLLKDFCEIISKIDIWKSNLWALLNSKKYKETWLREQKPKMTCWADFCKR